MASEIPSDSELSRLRAPSLVAWLVSNTELLIAVAETLGDRAGELAPDVPRERVDDLCGTVRHAALEITVALLALLARSEGLPGDGALGDAVASAHARLQQLGRAVTDTSTGACGAPSPTNLSSS
jgi:hypothetical protein